MTTHPDPLLALIELSEKATAGPWSVQKGALTLIEAPGPFGSTWAVAEAIDGISIDDVDHMESNAAFIAALVNWFRANAESLHPRPATELPELPEPCAEVFAADREGYDWVTPGKCYYTPDQMRAYAQQCASSRPANAREGGYGSSLHAETAQERAAHDQSELAEDARRYRGIRTCLLTEPDKFIDRLNLANRDPKSAADFDAAMDSALTTTPEPNNGR